MCRVPYYVLYRITELFLNPGTERDKEYVQKLQFIFIFFLDIIYLLFSKI